MSLATDRRPRRLLRPVLASRPVGALRVATAAVAACAVLVMTGGLAVATHTSVELRRVEVSCGSQARGGIASFMEMDTVTTGDGTGAFTGTVYNVARNNATRQQIGTITGRTSGTALSFTIREGVTHEATGTVQLPQGAAPSLGRLTGAVTVTSSSGATAQCTWAAPQAMVTALSHAAATAAPTAAARTAAGTAAATARATLGPAPAPAGIDIPVAPALIATIAVVGGGLALRRRMRSAGPARTGGADVADTVPRRRAAADRLKDPSVVEDVDHGETEQQWKERQRVRRLADIEKRVRAGEDAAASAGFDALAAGAGEVGARGVGLAADHGVSVLKEVTGTPGKIVDAAYTGAKAVGGGLAEGKSLGEAVGDGVTDILKGQVSDKVQDSVKLVRQVATGTPSTELADQAGKKLADFAKDVAAGKGQAADALLSYAGGQASSQATGGMADEGIKKIAEETGLQKPDPPER